MSGPSRSARSSPMMAMWRYTALRLGLFVGCLGALYLVGLHGFVLFVVALVASGVLSYPLARRQRDAMVRAHSQRGQRPRRGGEAR